MRKDWTEVIIFLMEEIRKRIVKGTIACREPYNVIYGIDLIYTPDISDKKPAFYYAYFLDDKLMEAFKNNTNLASEFVKHYIHEIKVCLYKRGINPEEYFKETKNEK